MFNFLKKKQSVKLTDNAPDFGGEVSEDVTLYTGTYYVNRYRRSALARRYIDLLAEDATANWRSVTCESAAEIEKAEKKQNVVNMFADLCQSARINGGAGIAIIIKDQDMEEPLDLDSINQSSDISYRVLGYNAGILAPAQYSENIIDPLSDQYRMPEFFQIGLQRVHYTRMIMIMGEKVPFEARVQGSSYYGDPALMAVDGHIQGVENAWADLNKLIGKGHLDFYKIEGLSDSSKEDISKLVSRIKRMSRESKATGFIAIDNTNESIERSPMNFSGIDAALSKLERVVSSVGGYPISYFWGDMQTGLSTEGGADREAYAKHVVKYQSSVLRQAIVKFDQVFLRSSLGYFPEDYDWDFNSIMQLSDKDRAEVNSKKIDSDLKLLGAQAITVSQLMAKWQKEGDYGITADQIADREAMENEAREVDQETADFSES
jgi:phage-related protein (TIGR01555 family)